MKILVPGAAGMLGRAVCAVLTAADHEVRATDVESLDITAADQCREAVAGYDVVVNAAAWTAVDAAETHEREAFAVNATGVANLARACRLAGARLVQISTDYVFDGQGRTPYLENHPLAPISAYGRTKAAGEWAARAECPDALIVRTAWLYGPGGGNFVASMARLASERQTVSVVTDQQGQPTATRDVAGAVRDLLAAGAPAGTYHATSEGTTTWFGLAQAVFAELGLDQGRVLPTTSAAYPAPAPRPAYSVLGHERTREIGLSPLPHWRAALAETLADVLSAQAAAAL